MASASEMRVEIGFQGGGGTGVTVDQSQWDQLKAALDGQPSGWLTLTGRDDSSTLVSLDKVAFVKVVEVSRSIGFGS
jgi:hypothetical protein